MLRKYKQKLLEYHLGISDDIPEEFGDYPISVSDLTIEELSNGRGEPNDDKQPGNKDVDKPEH